MEKRLFVGSDLHCGHLVGLTHPNYQISWNNASRGKYGIVQRKLWKFFYDEVTKNGPYDGGLFVGDLIEGSGTRSGGSELITTDRIEQCKIAVDCLKVIPFKKGAKKYIQRGTPYHVGVCEEFEDIIAKEIKADKIENHGYYSCEKAVISAKHHIGSAYSPLSDGTPLLREYTWAQKWALDYGFPLPTVIIRAHVHNFTVMQKLSCLMFTLPALQGLGSKFGSKLCSRTVDFGFCELIINDDQVKVIPHIIKGVQVPEIDEL
jgi:hypothetical protein